MVKTCPKCGGQMSIGSAHTEGDAYQYECLNCSYIEPVSRQPKEESA